MPKITQIDFSGMTESWLNKECTDMLLYAYDDGYKITVYTTTAGMTLTDLKRIVRVPFGFFMVHLADRDVNAKISVNDEYVEKLKYIVRMIKNTTFMTMEVLHSMLNFMKDKIINIPVISRFGNVESLDCFLRQGKIRCKSVYDLKHNVLFPDGRVLPRCMDYGMKHVLGNLLSERYNDLFEGKEFERIESEMTNGCDESDIICRECEYAISLE